MGYPAPEFLYGANVRYTESRQASRTSAMGCSFNGVCCVDPLNEQPGLRATAWSLAKDLADGVGSSSAPWVGYTASADCAFDMSGEQTSTRRSFRLPARSSVAGMSKKFLLGALRCDVQLLRPTTHRTPDGFSKAGMKAGINWLRESLSPVVVPLAGLFFRFNV